MKMTKLLRIRGQHHFVELYSEALKLTQCKPMHHYGERKKKSPDDSDAYGLFFYVSVSLCTTIYFQILFSK